MRRISEERQESNIRVTTLEASINKVLAENFPEELTYRGLGTSSNNVGSTC